jgi:hypothetical protein
MAVSGGVGGPNVELPNKPILGENEWTRTITLLDDTAAALPIPTGANSYDIGAGDGLPANYGSGAFVVATPANAAKSAATSANGANINLVVIALSGTTSTDVKLNVGVFTDGKLYVENRLGSTKTITVVFRA